MVSSAYIIFYRKKNGKKEYLVGRKYLISYLAAQKRHRFPDALVREVKKGKSLLNNKGSIIELPKSRFARPNGVALVGRRYDGVLLPAGGKIAVFGGRVEKKDRKSVEKKEDAKEKAALRELDEELNITDTPFIDVEILKKQTEHFKSFIKKESTWVGYYYAVCLDDCELSGEIDIEKYNEEASKITKLDTRSLRGSKGKTPTIAYLEWLTYEEIVKKYKDTYDREFAKKQLKSLYCYITNEKEGDTSEVVDMFSNEVITHIENNEPDDIHFEIFKEIEESSDLKLKSGMDDMLKKMKGLDIGEKKEK